MEFSFWTLVIWGIFASIFGSFLGLGIRILRTGISLRYILKAYRLAIVGIILVPFVLFPFIISKEKYKKQFINDLLDAEQRKTTKPYSRKERKATLEREWGVRLVLRFWLSTMRFISRTFDDYVDFNMSVIHQSLKKQLTRERITVLSQPKLYDFFEIDHLSFKKFSH